MLEYSCNISNYITIRRRRKKVKLIDLTHIWSSNLVHDWAGSLAKTEELKQFAHLNSTTAKTNCLSIELIYTNRNKCREMRERGGVGVGVGVGPERRQWSRKGKRNRRARRRKRAFRRSRIESDGGGSRSTFRAPCLEFFLLRFFFYLEISSIFFFISFYLSFFLSFFGAFGISLTSYLLRFSALIDRCALLG